MTGGGRTVRVAGAAALLVLPVLTGCTSEGETSTATATVVCGDYSDFGDLHGQTVRLATAWDALTVNRFNASLKPFTDCTGLTVTVQRVADVVKAAGATTRPDLVVLDGARLQSLASPLKLQPVAGGLTERLKAQFPSGVASAMTVGNATVAVPLESRLKSLVWYSPKRFASNDYQVPDTWDSMLALTERISRVSHADATTRPWCDGFGGDGADSGWPGTDWLEEATLRFAGTQTYDAWTTHRVPFNAPEIASALGRVGSVLRNPKYVNGGQGSPAGIAQTYFKVAGRPVLDGRCLMFRQGSFIRANWPQGTDISATGDLWVFYLPATKAEGEQPVLTTGNVLAALTASPGAKALLQYVSTAAWGASRAQQGPDFVPAMRGVPASSFPDALDAKAYEILTRERAAFRYDASDQMPTEIGNAVFWQQMIAWIQGQSDSATLANVEKAWK